MVYGLILAGGTGTRLGGEVPKQYIYVGKHRIIFYSTKAFVDSDLVDKICIVARDEWFEEIKSEIGERGLEKLLGFASPGENRQISIWNGMNYIKEKEPEITPKDVVIIQDAARPNVTKKMIEQYLENIGEYEGVLPVLPMKDTIYVSENGAEVTKLIDRSSLFAGQAPEVFLFERYLVANQKLLPNTIRTINGSTEPALLDGMKIKMVNGEESNFKITTQADLDIWKELYCGD